MSELPCASKRTYLRKSDAWTMARRTPKRDGRRAKPYFCASHDRWHVGHDFSDRKLSRGYWTSRLQSGIDNPTP